MVQTSWCEILILEVRSQSGEDVPVNPYQTNVLLHPDNKVPSPRAQLSPSKVQVLAKRRPTSVGGSLRARFPDSVQLPSLRSLAPRTQLALSSSGPQKGAGGRAHSLRPRPMVAALRSQRQRLQSVPQHLKAPAPGWPWRRLWSLCDASPASSLGAQLTRWFWARECAGGPWAEARVRSSLTSPHGHAPLLADPAPSSWLPDKWSPVGGAGPTLAPTNG